MFSLDGATVLNSSNSLRQRVVDPAQNLSHVPLHFREIICHAVMPDHGAVGANDDLEAVTVQTFALAAVLRKVMGGIEMVLNEKLIHALLCRVRAPNAGRHSPH